MYINFLHYDIPLTCHLQIFSTRCLSCDSDHGTSPFHSWCLFPISVYYMIWSFWFPCPLLHPDFLAIRLGHILVSIEIPAHCVDKSSLEQWLDAALETWAWPLQTPVYSGESQNYSVHSLTLCLIDPEIIMVCKLPLPKHVSWEICSNAAKKLVQSINNYYLFL